MIPHHSNLTGDTSLNHNNTITTPSPLNPSLNPQRDLVFPPGFRFCPTDKELVFYYLRRKVENLELPYNKIKDVILYSSTPDKLTKEYEPAGENTWYFFTPRDRKYKNGDRPSRTAGKSGGFWKATGKESDIEHPQNTGEVIGYKQTLVFYENKKDESKTSWIMQEFRTEKISTRKRLHDGDMKLDDCVLCKVYNTDYKSSKGKTKLEIGNETNPNSFDHHQSPANAEAKAKANMDSPDILSSIPFHNMDFQDTHSGFLMDGVNTLHELEDMSPHNIGMQQPLYNDFHYYNGYQHGYEAPQNWMNPSAYYHQVEASNQQVVENSCMNPVANNFEEGYPTWCYEAGYNPEKRARMNPTWCYGGPPSSSGVQSSSTHHLPLDPLELDTSFTALLNNPSPPATNATPSASPKDHTTTPSTYIPPNLAV